VISPTSLLPYPNSGEPVGTNESPANVSELKKKPISTPSRTASQSFSLLNICLISNIISVIVLGHGFEHTFPNAQDCKSTSNAVDKFDWMSFLEDGTFDDFDFEDIHSNPINHPLHIKSNQAAYALSTDPQAALTGSEDADPLFRLAELSIGLYKHSKEMPPLSIYESGIPSSEDIHEASEYKMEDIFRLTQDLVDIYPSFMRMFFQSSTWTSQTPLGPSAIFTLFSCHLRLIDISSILLKHVQVWISAGGKPCSFSPDAKYNPPQLVVGSFVPPQTSALPLQMMVFIQLASQLSHYAGNLFAEMEENEMVRENDSAARVTAELVKKKADWMAQELGRLRGGMLRLGFIV
jgi:hypothetical protein